MNSVSSLHIDEIVNQGFTVISNLFPPETINTALEKVKHLEETSPKLDDQYVPRLNKGTPNVYRLECKDKFFIDLFLDCKMLEEILKHFLNDPFYTQIPQDQPNYILRSLGARSTKGSLPLHIDSFIPYLGSSVIAMQCILFLEDSTIDRGCTIAIPGSHRLGLYADDSTRDLAAPIEAKAGDLYIQDGRLIHGCLENTTDKTRFACVGTFSRYWIKPHFNPLTIPKEMLDECTPKQRAILGLSSLPPDSELIRVDIKEGYK